MAIDQRLIGNFAEPSEVGLGSRRQDALLYLAMGNLRGEPNPLRGLRAVDGTKSATPFYAIQSDSSSDVRPASMHRSDQILVERSLPEAWIGAIVSITLQESFGTAQ